MAASLRYYAGMLAVIDGRLQSEQTGANVFSGIEEGKILHRVTLDWAIPAEGFEFDGRPHLGTDRRFTVAVHLFSHAGFPRLDANASAISDWCAMNPLVVCLRDAELVAFEVHQKSPKHHAFARGVFELRAGDLQGPRA